MSTTHIDESDMICLYHIRKSCSFQGKWAKTSWVKSSLFLICDVNATIFHHILRIVELDHLGWIQSLFSTEIQNKESLDWWFFGLSLYGDYHHSEKWLPLSIWSWVWVFPDTTKLTFCFISERLSCRPQDFFNSIH